MLFNSYEFLFALLPIVLVGYYLLLPKVWRHAWLVLASFIFYGWWDYRFCSLLLLTITIDYVAGGASQRRPTQSSEALAALFNYQRFIYPRLLQILRFGCRDHQSDYRMAGRRKLVGAAFAFGAAGWDFLLHLSGDELFD